MGNTNPRLLNLDDLELPESDITVRNKGIDHKMRVLTVELFITQQKRAAEHQRLVVAQADEAADDTDMADIVALIRDSIAEFFPTLPVNEMETTKLFTIFAWLNELSSKINEEAAPEEALQGDESAEGNVPALETPTVS